MRLDQLQKVRLLIEQCPEYVGADFNEEFQDVKNPNVYNEKIEYAARYYKIWLRDKCIDFYSGREIPFSGLFDDNRYDVEHTVPRSMVLNNGFENKTITEANFNRRVKGRLLPAQLSNYDDVILPNLQPWQERVKRLEERVDFWIKERKHASDPDWKDYCIVQNHVWQMELDYWSAKLEFFTIREVKADFVSKQLSDTRVISKYVFHYLKSFFNRVDMQYGCATAIFRDIFGLPKKDRSRHTHHAIDAMMLSFIPTTAQRDKMMNLFFQIDEAEKNGHIAETENLRIQLEYEKNLCLYGYQPRSKHNISLATLAQHLEETLLVNHANRDQTRTPARKKGVIKKNGAIRKIVKTGDCIRGQIHKDSFFGAITQWEVNEHKELIKNENNQPIVDETHVKYVVRIPLKKGEGMNGFKDWNDLEERIIDKTLYQILKDQKEGLSFSKACEEGFYVKRKLNGKTVYNRIRHVRSQVPKNQGHVQIKQHITKSKKPYKQWYYAGSGDLQYACQYKGTNEFQYRLYSLYDIACNRKCGEEDIPQEIQGKKELLSLSRIIKTGDMVMLYNELPEELNSLNEKEKSKRLYRIAGFEKDGTRIKLVKHYVAATVQKKDYKSYDNFDDRISAIAIMMSLNKIKFCVV